MIDRLKILFSARPQAELAPSSPDDEVRRAVATLMFIAALMDTRIDDEERAVIADSIAERFGLSAEATAELMAEAEDAAHDATHFQRFTAEIKSAYDDQGRRDVMEMLWRVICADGEVHHREANLMRRIAGLLYVTDKDSGLARQRALAAIAAEG
ncbi:MAG: TerB family tellurite resistance protein [Alphaproteobacteria bacterium]